MFKPLILPKQLKVLLNRFGALGWIRHHFEYIGDCCVRLDFSKGFNIFSFSHFTALNFTLESQSWNSVCLIYHYWAVLRITESNSKVELCNWATLSSQHATRRLLKFDATLLKNNSSHFWTMQSSQQSPKFSKWWRIDPKAPSLLYKIA